jgi:hypothetical protein
MMLDNVSKKFLQELTGILMTITNLLHRYVFHNSNADNLISNSTSAGTWK